MITTITSRDHDNERGPRPIFATCGNCGGYPIGTGCYHICFNSVHYYTPEQERRDDATYGDDDIRERYSAEMADMAYECDIADQMEAESEAPMFEVVGAAVYDVATDSLTDYSDDLPF